MAEEKKQNVKTEKPAKAVKEVKPKLPTIADTVDSLKGKFFATKTDMAKEVLKQLSAKNVTKNIRGHTIDEKHVVGQIGAIFNCIEKKNGPKRWHDYKLVKDEKQGFKFE